MDSILKHNCRTFYVYQHINPHTGTPFYIGKGTIQRAYNFRNRVDHYKEYLKENNIVAPKVIILEKSKTLDEADKLENEYILKYGRIGFEEGGVLINQSVGGSSGYAGVKSNEERNTKISNTLKQYFKNKKTI